MTVRELIEELQSLNPDHPVRLRDESPLTARITAPTYPITDFYADLNVDDDCRPYYTLSFET